MSPLLSRNLHPVELASNAKAFLDPLFQIVRHCSLKFGCLVWVMVRVMAQAERID
jgi:hypothetical protein